MVSAAKQDYLTAIYRVGRAGALVSNSAIAERLEVAAPSVTGMIKHLAKQGLVEHVRYRGSRLTEAGEAEALKVIRRRRVLQTYLVQVLGYAQDQVHEEADRLEHATSDELIDRMSRTMGDPPTDPHVALIPELRFLP